MNVDGVRSSVARHLGVEIEGLPETDRYVDGVVSNDRCYLKLYAAIDR
ncbi:hypothetical protein [Bacteroides cellulosilyticus]|nr:hypothetical protein [Bacteroides cellulosilyticus]